MKTATGTILQKNRIPTNPGFTYLIQTDDDREFNFAQGQPVTLVNLHPREIFAPGIISPATTPKQELKPAVAAQLNATHVGKRVRVETLDGTIVEDILESMGITWKEGAVIHVDFKNVRPRGPQEFTFRVAPAAPVTIIEETK